MDAQLATFLRQKASKSASQSANKEARLTTQSTPVATWQQQQQQAPASKEADLSSQSQLPTSQPQPLASEEAESASSQQQQLAIALANKEVQLATALQLNANKDVQLAVQAAKLAALTSEVQLLKGKLVRQQPAGSSSGVLSVVFKGLVFALLYPVLSFLTLVRGLLSALSSALLHTARSSSPASKGGFLFFLLCLIFPHSFLCFSLSLSRSCSS